ncbi:MAG TPA: cobalamin-independent methionine synthase II family protein [Stellaceae bacterium]|jgi:5-methyltetrahydropteroyltriglutamate--homocysteine methyltransferase|nr:cobalamin-independent methionine synthase II family protein [Stellaceae bacterium]
MKRSTDRILTTHAGSLPRPDDLLPMIRAKAQNGTVDEQAFAARVKTAVSETVRRQIDAGVDVVGDGEVGRVGFIPYVNERLAGIEPSKGAEAANYWALSREYQAFPQFYAWATAQAGAAGIAGRTRWVCSGPVSYKGHAALQHDIDNLKAALVGQDYAEAFMPAVSPSNLANWNTNEHYKSEEEYLYALADALHEEYQAVIDAGLVLQIDDPLLASYYVMHPEASVEDCRKWAAGRIAVLNHALRGLPQDRIRYHTCYSINIGPRVHDMELKNIVDLILTINAGAYSFEAANPRHEHEWQVWETVKLPDGKCLIPGVITHSSNIVEHPEAIAQRIGRFARTVGRENVIAGADCGFASFASTCEVHPSVVWVKFAALAEGARIASRQLWR